jgi:hypothetical protein
MTHIAKKSFLIVLSALFLFSLFSVPKSFAAGTPASVEIEDLGNGFTSETVWTIYPATARSSYNVTGKAERSYKYNGSEIATITFTVKFSYNGTSSSVVSTSYSKSLTSGWSYTDHKITTSGGSATMTGNLKKSSLSVPVRINITCSPTGTITKS